MSSRTDLTKMGKHIFDLRKGLGYTQKQLGEMLDVSDKTVSKWEQGDIAPDITILTSLASALKVSVNEILYGEKEEKENEDEKSIKLLNLYTEQTKISLTKKIVLFIFTILVVAIFVFYMEDYYKWKVIKIEINADFYANGYAVKNYKNTKIVINNIQFLTDDQQYNLKIKSLNVKVLDEKNTLYNKSYKYEDMYLINALENINLFFEKNQNLNIDSLKLEIDYVDETGKVNSFVHKFC